MRVSALARTSLSIPSWKEVPVGLFFFMKSIMTFFDWPIEAIVKEPILFSRITWGQGRGRVEDHYVLRLKEPIKEAASPEGRSPPDSV